MFTVSLPVIFINAPINDTKSTFGPADIVGVVMFGLGLIIETVADQQKFSFRNDPANKDKFCDVGEEKVFLLCLFLLMKYFNSDASEEERRNLSFQEITSCNIGTTCKFDNVKGFGDRLFSDT